MMQLPLLIGVANKNTVFAMLMVLTKINLLKYIFDNFNGFIVLISHLQIPKSVDLAIFVPMTDKTDCFTHALLCMRMWGKNCLVVWVDDFADSTSSYM